MKQLRHSHVALIALLASLPNAALAVTVTCRADGLTDATVCLENVLRIAHQRHDSQILLNNGTYLVSRGIVVPDKVQLIGVGGGINLIGSHIVASPSFPLHGTVVKMGADGVLNFGVQVKNLHISGGHRADYGLQNKYSMELSYGEDLLITDFLKAGLDVEGGAAQNSGPFRNLEIYPDTGSGLSVTNETRCIIVQNVIAFRGIENVTCNAGINYLTRPDIALQLDGAGSYSNFHIEHFATAVHLGSDVTAADGLIFANGQFGPGVDTGILIGAETPDQNLSITGVSCYSCTTVLADQVTGKHTPWAVGFYFLGNGAGADKKVFTSVNNM